MKHIGIICEGPTDYIILKGVIDRIIGEENTYVMLQPENDLTGKYGNGCGGGAHSAGRMLTATPPPCGEPSSSWLQDASMAATPSIKNNGLLIFICGFINC